MSEPPWYQPIVVADDLSRDLVTGWVARTDQTHQLVPDGCIDVMWTGGGQAVVCSPETTGWTFGLSADAEAVGVRFRPGRAASVLGLDASDLRERQVRLGDVLGARTHRTLIGRLGEAAPGRARVRVLEPERTPAASPVHDCIRLRLGDAASDLAAAAVYPPGQSPGRPAERRSPGRAPRLRRSASTSLETARRSREPHRVRSCPPRRPCRHRDIRGRPIRPGRVTRT